MKSIARNNLGKKYLVEDCQNIRIDGMVRKARKKIFDAIITGIVEIAGHKVEVATKKLHHGGERLWFVCPVCRMAAGVLYKHPVSEIIGCRRCLDLDYRCRRYRGMAENSL